MIDSSRAQSVQATYQVTLALTAAQKALTQGRESDAQRLITTVQPQLARVQEPQRKDELTRKSTNLLTAAAQTPLGQPVDTDDYGVAREHDGGRESTSRHPSNPDTGTHEPTPHPYHERASSRTGRPQPARPPGIPRPRPRPRPAMATTAVTAPVVGTAVVSTDSRAVGKSATLLPGSGEERLALSGNLPGQLVPVPVTVVHFAAALYTDADTVWACAAFRKPRWADCRFLILQLAWLAMPEPW